MATPLPQARPTTTYSPQPAPAPSSGSSDWNNQWNQIWNQSFNAGFNLGSKPSVDSSFNSAVEQGYSAGQAKRPTTQKVTTPTGLTTNNIAQNNSPVSSNDQNIGSMQNDINSEIDNLYNQSNSLFNQQEGNLASQKANAESGVQLQGKQAQDSYNSAWVQAQELAKANQNTLNQTKQNTDSESLRNFNALEQNAQARYGANSSTGSAVHEIVSQEFLRNKNSLAIAFQNSLDKVFSFQADAQKTYTMAGQKLQEDIAQKFKDIDQAFKDGMITIASNRAMNEQNRSQAKVSLMQESLQNARALQNFKIENQIQLDTWLEQQKQTSNDALSYAKSLATQSETNTFNDANSMQNQNSSSFLNYNTNPNQNTAMYRPLQPKANEDDYSKLNPWLA